MDVRIARACVLWLVAGSSLAAFGQATGPPVPPLVLHSTTGQDLFAFYCATCHGRDGKGNGPVVAALKAPPPDLTLLARRHGGRFPRQRVEAFVASDASVLTPAHGRPDMPVWGPIFRALDSSDVLADVRIANVVQHVESLQAK